MKRLVFLVLVSVSANWAAGDEPPPGPVPGLDPAAYTGNNTDFSWVFEGETSIEERSKSDRAYSFCTRAGGFCVPNSAQCNGTVDRQGCRGRDWKCCMPCVLPDCKPKRGCSFAGGHCVKNAADCTHGVIDRQGCKGPGCMCCVPSSFGLPWVYLNYSDGSSGDAFVPFSIINTDWYTAQCICRNHGLNLYHPNNIEAVSNYLTNEYENGAPWYWIGAKGDGSAQHWLNGGVLPLYSNPPWLTPEAQYYDVGINCCMAMVATTGWDGYIFTWTNSQDICKSTSTYIFPLCG